MATKRWQGNTSALWDTAANWIGGAVPVAGDDVQMLSGDKGANYCTTGPASAITINSLTITIAASVGGPNILMSNGQKVSISTTFSYTDAAGMPSNGNLVGSSSGSYPILLNGCTGTATVQPPTLLQRTMYLQVDAGATLTMTPRAYNNPTNDYGVAGYYGPMSGTLTMDAGSSPSAQVYISSAGAGAVINMNNSGRGTSTILAATGAFTLNVNGQSVFSCPSAVWPHSHTFNVNAPAVFTGTAPEGISANQAFNAAASLTLGNFMIASGKTVTVNVLSPDAEIVPVDVTGSGTLAVVGRYARGLSGTMARG